VIPGYLGKAQHEFESDERKSGALRGNIGVDMDHLPPDGASPSVETQQQDASHGEVEQLEKAGAVNCVHVYGKTHHTLANYMKSVGGVYGLDEEEPGREDRMTF